MNPERNKSGMTVDTLMQLGLFSSAGIAILAFGVIGAMSIQRPDITVMILTIVVLAIFVLVGIIFVNYIVQRRIKSRILDLVDVCRDFVGGERAVRAVVNGDDDFAMLAVSLNTLLDNQGSGTASSQGGGTNDAAALQAQIEKLLQEVSAVGDGDLRVQAEVTPDTLGVLADSFNYMIEELAKVVGRVQSTAVQVTNATRRILDRSGDLAQASEAQVAQISQTTEAVEALAIFIQNVARSAQVSVEAAQDALHNAAQGQQSVRQTIEGMMLIRENVQETAKKIKRLGERSNEIGEIVRIIEDIADQTNLLALNAAIQSAMAGEHGRGFAVVADEIRLLAERSTESTKRIATLIKSIQGDTYEAVVAMEDSTQEVVKGSQLADEAGRSLNAIYGAVDRQAQMIEGIARSANEQTTVSEAVAVAMGRILELTRQTDAGTQEATVSVSYLAELSEQLRASVATFRLPDRGNDVAGSFSHMGTSISEFDDGSQAFPQLGPGGENEWGQPFAGNFPPLPEPNNTGSLVALASRAGAAGGQYNFSNQQDFNSQMAFGDQQQNNAFMQQQGQGFQSQPGFGNAGGQQPYGNQSFMPPDFGNAGGQQPYGNQSFMSQDFADMGQFENQQGYGGNGGNGYGSQQFGGRAAPGGPFNQNQQPYPPASQLPNSGNPPYGQQPANQQNARPRWQQGAPQGQGYQE